MNKEEMLQKIIEVIDPIDEITSETVISECDDIDSLALFSLVVFLKNQGKNYSLADLGKCNTVGDLVDLALK
ncbi:hypothetical protein SAMN02745213_01174 [Succinivibrio dextrinosolvens DSM 3072]|uniref:Carrier domain-containing protein n=1 Tax=Succinivibrio dextrinosolvens DSM 3072 TaxID=1123324 RepID=A0A1T4VAA5_9GAMM|nr:acyl carrier protein [Succinivibrio dextrinosolvens]SKA61930.1 hypothetical protein SAMN02745213_01174 [Succinivibrio dextrinosolvens DSM 3072]